MRLFIALSVFLSLSNVLFAQQTAALEWAKRIGGTGNDASQDIFLDAAGNIYTTGSFSGTVDFDPGIGTFNLTSAGSNDIFILKLDANGNFMWARSMGGSGSDGGAGIAVDLSGNIYITGGFQGTADFDPGPGTFTMTAATTGQTDIYIAKLDVNGNFIWAKGIIGGTWWDNGLKIVLDGSANVHVVGRFYFQGGPRDFDPGPGTFFLTAGQEDAFILKLDTNGDFIWARNFGGGFLENRGYSIVLDAAGNIYTTGYFEGTIDFDPGVGVFNLTASGDWDIYYSKLDANGNFVWARAMVNSHPTYYTEGTNGSKISLDDAGNVYVTSRFNGTVDFDPGAGVFNLTSQGSFDIYMTKLTTDGDFLWAKSMGGSGYDEGMAISNDAAGNVYVTGYYAQTVDFDPGVGVFNLTSTGSNDAFICKLDTDGNFEWAGSIGGTVDDRGIALKLDAASNIFMLGWFQGTADFDPRPCTYNLTSAGSNDIFIQKLTQVAVLPPPTITSFTPSSGPVGTTVAITGTNFSTIPANNTVLFNSTPSIVTASTSTSITTTVPAGATTGKISVTVNCITVQSATDFIVPSAQNFITQWNLATAGSGATQLSFGTATSGTVNYTWQEISPGTASGSGSWSGATLTITGLPTGATIRLQIAPANFQRMIINIGADRNRLTQVEQWGSTAWTSMQNAFSGCANLQVTATDVPDLSGVTIMSGMFRFCNTLNSPSNIGSWNTSVVIDMSSLFSQAYAFNQNISSWNTGAVTNMSNLFGDATAFNQDIGAWNTTAVINMAAMFAGAVVFNRNIAAWNTAAVTDMNSMFFSAYAFNQNIGGWNTAAVTNMGSMFGYAYDFNQNIGTWNTSAVTNMSRMFEDAFDFNQNIGTWNTSAVTNMRGMFIDAYAFNQNIGTWNTLAVTDMSRMFDFATAFNQNIGAWNTAAVTDLSGMFADASAFNQNIGTWSLNPGVNLAGMLNNSNMDCSNYSATLIGWSANASTPNGRTFGATGRQYGTNAVTARTNLVSTKLWIITGDSPSGVDCGSVLVPTITSFTPVSGPIGTTVTVTGTNFDGTPANNVIMFNGTTAVVTASTATSITTTVPSGATTGKIAVTVAGNTATSTSDFAVTTVITIAITTQPSDASVCDGEEASFTTSATGTTNITYQWQTFDGSDFNDIADGGAYAGANGTNLNINTVDGFGFGDYRCVISGDNAVDVFTNMASLTLKPIQDCNNNQPPVINATPLTTSIGGIITLDLTTIISDPDNNIDFSTLNIVSPPASGASSTIDNTDLILDYNEVNFSGIDQLTLEICDLLSSCVQQEISIEVIGDVVVYNAISPNNDGLNDILFLQYIDIIEEAKLNKITIFNRWGDEVFSIENYNNVDRVFNGMSNSGKELPSGTYFYKLNFASSLQDQTGYLVIKR